MGVIDLLLSTAEYQKFGECQLAVVRPSKLLLLLLSTSL